MGIATRLKLARLMHYVPDEPDAVAALARASFAGGADIVILDEDLTHPIADETATHALADITEAARATQGLSAYHGRPVRAAMLSPDLVVLADDEASAARTRALVGEWTMIGRECNTPAEIDAALADRWLDFFLVGPGLELIRHAAEKAPANDPASKTWFAIGGITEASLDAVIRAGARRVAVGAGITKASDPEGAALAMKNRLREAWNDDPRMEDVISSAFGTSPKLNLAPTRPKPPSGLRVDGAAQS